MTHSLVGIMSMTEFWQVLVLRGATDIDVTRAPTKFGTPQTSPTDDGELTNTIVPLVYGPVGIRSVDLGLVIETAVRESEETIREHMQVRGSYSPRTEWHREMVHVHRFEFTWGGAIRVEGLEADADGRPAFAVWEIEPYEPAYDEDEDGHDGEQPLSGR